MYKAFLISVLAIGIFTGQISRAENVDSLENKETATKKNVKVDMKLASLEVTLISKEEQELIDMINEFRKKNGISPLEVDSPLCNVAKQHSREMVEKNFLDTIALVQGLLNERQLKAGIWDYPGFALTGKGDSVKDLCQQFEEKNERTLLDSSFTHMGIGTVITNSREIVGTICFVRRIVEISPGFVGKVNLPAKSSKPATSSFTIRGSTRMKYLKFSVFNISSDSLERCIASKPLSTKEIVVPEKGKFNVELPDFPYPENVIVLIEAKQNKTGKYFTTNCIIQ